MIMGSVAEHVVRTAPCPVTHRQGPRARIRQTTRPARKRRAAPARTPTATPAAAGRLTPLRWRLASRQIDHGSPPSTSGAAIGIHHGLTTIHENAITIRLSAAAVDNGRGPHAAHAGPPRQPGAEDSDVTPRILLQAARGRLRAMAHRLSLSSSDAARSRKRCMPAAIAVTCRRSPSDIAGDAEHILEATERVSRRRATPQLDRASRRARSANRASWPRSRRRCACGETRGATVEEAGARLERVVGQPDFGRVW